MESEAISNAAIEAARSAIRNPIFASNDIHGRAVESAIYRMNNSEIARCYLRLVAAMEEKP